MIAPAITKLFGGYLNRDGQDLIVEDRVERLPTEAEQELIDVETLRLETEATANAYRQQRAEEYAPLAEQLDNIYHNGIDAWKATIKVTKDKYPKG